MADEIMKKIEDNYREHQEFHQSYHVDCSECWKERRMLTAFKTVNDNKIRKELKNCATWNGNDPLTLSVRGTGAFVSNFLSNLVRNFEEAEADNYEANAE